MPERKARFGNIVAGTSCWGTAMRRYIVAAAFVMIGAAGAYAADESATDAKVKRVGTRHGVCSADIHKFCDDFEHCKGKIRDCLAEHSASLSPACKTRIERRAKTTK
jgi:hypothetical protein